MSLRQQPCNKLVIRMLIGSGGVAMILPFALAVYFCPPAFPELQEIKRKKLVLFIGV